MEPIPSKSIKIHIKGLVQGVGFRPFVYRVAKKNEISGWVKNQQDGVFIEATGKTQKLVSFTSDIKNNFPPAAQIIDFRIFALEKIYKNGFHIVQSEASNSLNEITQIGPDIAVCDDCLTDLKKQNHRIDYPLINCTNCGPRFSIIKDLPYDRDKTTMDRFKMCPECQAEYENPLDRRFHAQPLACLHCGPHYSFVSKDILTDKLDKILERTSELIDAGKIVAIKGIGGFFIACDAENDNATDRLRKRKNREGKPFAVMLKDVQTAKKFCSLDAVEEQQLTSWQRPIVILTSKNRKLNILPKSVSNGISTMGILLPYMPFHYLLFERLKTTAIVFTSGNFSDEPIVISNQKAEKDLFEICDAVVSYNRTIFNRTDDSLLRVINKKPRLMRRSRGFAPNPIYLDFDVDGILATGAELKNTFCLGKEKQAIISQHIGDLKDFETFSFYEKNIQQFQKMFRVEPELIVTDLHPDYLSTKYAFDANKMVIQVQHHHAHIASAMVENGLDEKVIGVSFDGTGLGDDGTIWGSEFFVCDLANYERKIHFMPIPLPGGDLATKDIWRSTVSYLYTYFGREMLKDLKFLKGISEEELEWVIQSIDKKINCPLSSGSGRLFDAVSALLNVCKVSTFEAEAPMRLENIIIQGENGFYPFNLTQVIDFSQMFNEIICDLKRKIEPGIIAAKFHNTVSQSIIEGVKVINKKTGIKKVVLSGGTFQNKYLTERTENKLNELGFAVYSNLRIPCNDGGISLGQLAIAGKKHALHFL